MKLRVLNNKIPINCYIVNFTYPKSTLTLSTDANDNGMRSNKYGRKENAYKLYRNSRIENYITPIYTVDEKFDSRPNEDVLEFTDIIPQENQTQDNVYYYTVKIDDYPIGNIYKLKDLAMDDLIITVADDVKNSDDIARISVDQGTAQRIITATIANPNGQDSRIVLFISSLLEILEL